MESIAFTAVQFCLKCRPVWMDQNRNRSLAFNIVYRRGANIRYRNNVFEKGACRNCPYSHRRFPTDRKPKPYHCQYFFRKQTEDCCYSQRIWCSRKLFIQGHALKFTGLCRPEYLSSRIRRSRTLSSFTYNQTGRIPSEIRAGKRIDQHPDDRVSEWLCKTVPVRNRSCR